MNSYPVAIDNIKDMFGVDALVAPLLGPECGTLITVQPRNWGI